MPAATNLAGRVGPPGARRSTTGAVARARHRPPTRERFVVTHSRVPEYPWFGGRSVAGELRAGARHALDEVLHPGPTHEPDLAFDHQRT